MITVLSMNPCIDLTLTIPGLTIGGSHRAHGVRQDVSGKAVNVAYALKNLDIPCEVLGFDFIENGSLLKEALDDAKISYDLVPTVGSIRTNVKIFEEAKQRMTEINQEGAIVTKEALSLLLEKVINVKTDVLILSGSLPLGIDHKVYGEIIRQVKVPVILDAYGLVLAHGVEAGPYIIKPNISEMEQAFGLSLPTRESQLAAGQDLLRRHKKLRALCLSLGEEGALMIGREEAFFAPVLDIPVRGVQGAGDSLVAGLAMEIAKTPDAPLDVLLKSAVAIAAASLIREGSQMATKEGFAEMLEKVEIVQVYGK